jgi:hypothetical protein
MSPSDIKNGFIVCEEVRNFVKTLKIEKQRDWNIYCMSMNKPNIPSNPWKTYKNNGWTGWNDWLCNGKEKGKIKVKRKEMV